MAKPVIPISSGCGSSTLPPAAAPAVRKSRSTSLPSSSIAPAAAAPEIRKSRSTSLSSSSIAPAADSPPLLPVKHPKYHECEATEEFMRSLPPQLRPKPSTAPSLEPSPKPCDGSCGDVSCKSRASASTTPDHSPPPSPDVFPKGLPLPDTLVGCGGLEHNSPHSTPPQKLRASPAVLDASGIGGPDDSDNEADSHTPALSRVLDFSKEDSSSTSSRQKPAADPAASSTTLPSIDKQAQLSKIETVLDWGFNIWRWVRTLPGRLTSAAGSKASGTALDKVQHAAIDKAAEFLPNPPSDTPLKKLRDCLFYLHDQVSTSAEIDGALKKSSITALSDFLLNQKRYFEESVDPAGYKVTLTVAQDKQFILLLKYLQENGRISASFINPLYELIDKYWKYEQLFHKKKIAQQFFGKAPSTTPAPPLKRNREHRLAAPSQQAPEKPISKNSIPIIITEIEQLKSLGFKISLALLILPESSMSKVDQENGGLLAGLIKKADETLDPLKDSNEIFLSLLFIELDNSELNFVQRTWKKFTCRLLAPFILFMIEHVLDQSRDLALYLIGLTPEERLNRLVEMFIKPSFEFISKLHSEYISLSKNADIGTTPDVAISRKIAQIEIEDLSGKVSTPKDLINGLVGSLIDKYSPSFDWRNAATEHFAKRSKESKSPFVAAWFMGWSYLTWSIGILFAPFRWCIHVTVRKILKNIVVSKIHSKLQDTTDSSWDFGRLALNSLYKTLYDKLLKRNRTKRTTESQDRQKKLAIEQTAFVDHSVQDNIHGLVVGFLKVLYFQGSDLIDLHTKLAPANSVEQTKVLARDYVYGHLAQKATEGIIHGLQVFLEGETFPAAICEVLQDIHQQCLRFNASSSERNLARLEKDFYTELQDAVKRGIEDIIDEKLDPSSIIQEEANLFVDGLKYDIEAFKTEFMAVPDLTPAEMSNLVELRDKFLNDALRRRTERAGKQTNASARVHIGTIAKGFHALRRPIYRGLDLLSDLAAKQKSTLESIQELEKLISPLDKAIVSTPLIDATLFYKELQLTLQKIRTKTYPAPVQKLISKLQVTFDLWTTESAKKLNQSHINGAIIELLQAVQQSINEERAKLEELDKSMSKTHEQTSQQVNALSEWAKKLQYFTCTPDTKEISFIKEFLLRFAEDGLSPLIIKQLDAFFLFLGKNHNIKGLLWYVIKAYLELPHKSPQEFKKIIDKVISKLEATSSNPAPSK